MCVCVCVDRAPLVSELLYFSVEKEFHFLFSDYLYSPQIRSNAFAMGMDRFTRKMLHKKKPKVEALVILQPPLPETLENSQAEPSLRVPSRALAQVAMQGWGLGLGYWSGVLPRHMEFLPQAAARPQPWRPRQCLLPKHTPSRWSSFPRPRLTAGCWESGADRGSGGWGVLTLTSTRLSHHARRTERDWLQSSPSLPPVCWVSWGKSLSFSGPLEQLD